jgi:homoaconitase
MVNFSMISTSSKLPILPYQGGTGRILEYFGPGVSNLSCTGRLLQESCDSIGFHVFNISGLATVANMGAEVGATTSTFPYTASMRAYLKATGRESVAQAADGALSKGFLTADEGAEYDDLVEIVRSTITMNVHA